MITELTPEQEAQLAVYAEKWRKIGLSSEPANRPEAERGVRLAYELAGHKPPIEIIWCDSPEYMYLFAVENFLGESLGLDIQQTILYDIRKTIRTKLHRSVFRTVEAYFLTNLRNNIWNATKTIERSISVNISRVIHGQHGAYYLAQSDYFRNAFNFKRETQKIKGLELVAQNAGWYIPYKYICLISERHTILNLDHNGRPHCEDGFAISYLDGWGAYAWHGVYVPEYVIMQPERITPKGIMRVGNIEMARILLERYGQDSFIRDGGFSKVQSDDYGDLYRIEMSDGEPIVAIHVQDASTDRDYFLYVPPHIRTAHEGVAWTFGYDNGDDYNPSIET